MIKFLKLYEKIGIFILIVAASVFLAIVSPNFRNLNTILSIIMQGSYGAIIAFGMTFAITSGGFDLSVEAIMGFTSVIIAMLIPSLGFAGSIIIAILASCFVGFLNGVLITKVGISPLITTLSMQVILRGASLIITNGRQVVISQKSFMSIGASKVFNLIPTPIIYMVVLFAIFYLILNQTSFGRHVAASGSNEQAAKMSGLNVNLIKTVVYILVAFSASIVGVIRTSQTLIGIPTMAPGFTLNVLTIAILGGTSLAGGKGNLTGTLFAGIFISMIYYGLNLLNVQIFYQMLAVGITLLFALFIDGLRMKYLETAKVKGIRV
ncbi:MAG: ABC transporter permease [Actinobacteria bacterium]|nr:ABC transporter permease [Actinomycetota bacterium]